MSGKHEKVKPGPARDPRRRYNKSEHIALYLASDGNCSHCGQELGPGWHADHIDPWSVGGSTNVINGQALCAHCNLRKRASMNDVWKQYFRISPEFRMQKG